MKRNYIKPSQRTVALDTRDLYLMIPGSGQLGQQVEEGGNAVKGAAQFDDDDDDFQWGVIKW